MVVAAAAVVAALNQVSLLGIANVLRAGIEELLTDLPIDNISRFTD